MCAKEVRWAGEIEVCYIPKVGKSRTYRTARSAGASEMSKAKQVKIALCQYEAKVEEGCDWIAAELSKMRKIDHRIAYLQERLSKCESVQDYSEICELIDNLERREARMDYAKRKMSELMCRRDRYIQMDVNLTEELIEEIQERYNDMRDQFEGLRDSMSEEECLKYLMTMRQLSHSLRSLRQSIE